MTVRSDLIEARALIDTPEKWEAMGKSHSAALYEATTSWQAYMAADQALAMHRVRGVGLASVLNMFDRAISAQPEDANV